jgi:hypothetical protein
MPDAVDTVVCAPDGGWWYHLKHVQQFPDKINCVTLHLVGYILEYLFQSIYIYIYEYKMNPLHSVHFSENYPYRTCLTLCMIIR